MSIVVLDYEDKNNIRYSVACGWCNHTVSLNVHTIYYSNRNDSYVRNGILNDVYFYVGQCPNCYKPVIIDLLDEVATPLGKPFQEFNHIPDAIRSVYNEMRSCFSSGSYTACTLLGRILIMHVACDQGLEVNKDFQTAVKYIYEKKLVPANSEKWIDYIRKAGNEVNHKLFLTTQDQAFKLIKFVVSLITIVYELPSSIED